MNDKWVLKYVEGLKFSVPFLFVLLRDVKRWPILGLFIYICKVFYSYYLSFRLFGFSIFPKVIFMSQVFKVHVDIRGKIRIAKGAKLIFDSYMYGDDKSVLVVEEGAELAINSNFTIGNGCLITVFEGGRLVLNGGLERSGITCHSKILCRNSVEIGEGCIISWGVYITDSSHHLINGQRVDKPVKLGDNVWVSEGVSIFPGSNVGSGSIIASKSVCNGLYPDHSMLAGVPAVVKKNHVKWS